MKENINERRKPGVVLSLWSGACAGAVAKTIIAPLDRTKIYFQVSSTRGYSFKSAIKFIKLTFKENGFFALFRGNSATMARVVPYASIQFTAFEQFKTLLSVDENGTRTPLRRYLVGSLAATTATLITYPLDTAKARLSVSTKSQYHSLRAVFVKMYKEGGIRLLYRGINPTILGVIPYAGTSFFTYETLKILYRERTHERETSMWRMLFGMIAGLIGQSSSYPLDIVRRRMQTGRIPHGWGPLRALVHIYQTEGLKRGLYKGLSMNWVKGPIAVGVSFTTYERVNLIKKGDVIWVPYRKCPMWPALVQNVYPKKAAYALCTTDVPAPDSDSELKEAFAAACQFLRQRGATRGSVIRGKYEGGSGSPTATNENQNQLITKKRKSSRDEFVGLKRDGGECSSSSADHNRRMSSSSKESWVSPVKMAGVSPSTSSQSSVYRAKSIPVRNEKISKDLTKIIKECVESEFEILWNGQQVKAYKKPRYDHININFRNNVLLVDEDLDYVINKLVEMVQKRDASFSFIHSLHITCTVLLPQIIVISYSKYKSIPYEQALRVCIRPKIKPNSTNSQQNGGLEELCRIACELAPQ
ncbi:unnamed protein product [Caenorhabditis bovis]|uniref:Uncharacterized protein n=1 Tax=Caenorhabditis bovis TaxID=2654633 RepID=A0A8S1EVW7_9PELO|nr:unnamed protein product [Caenorhabditis bovis]